jgi:hypothetical protein
VVSTGNLLADCERWCRDHLPPRKRPDPVPRQARRTAAPEAPVTPSDGAAAEERAPARSVVFRPGPGWPGAPVIPAPRSTGTGSR